jgi:hypothetical protein
MIKPYTKQQFELTLDGAPKSLTLKGISTPRLTIIAEMSNLEPVYLGNVFENGNGEGVVVALNPGNNIDALLNGQTVNYDDMQQFDRLPRTRNFYIERNRLHVMSEWFAQGRAGDVIYVVWYWDGQSFLDVATGLPINISNLDR